MANRNDQGYIPNGIVSSTQAILSCKYHENLPRKRFKNRYYFSAILQNNFCRADVLLDG